VHVRSHVREGRTDLTGGLGAHVVADGAFGLAVGAAVLTVVLVPAEAIRRRLYGAGGGASVPSATVPPGSG
jgi:hypothetical protein